MIDFRYHLVSIVAVFLALAIGLVVGATALKPKTQELFDQASRREQQQISAQRAQIKALQAQVGSDQAAARADAPLVLANLLQGQRVVLVIAPGADGPTVSGVTAALQQAGATVTARAALEPAFFDTSVSTENELDALARQVAPPGTRWVQPGSSQIAGQREAAQVLAPALVTGSGADLPARQAKAIVDGFTAQGFLQLSPVSGAAVPAQATLAVVVTPATPPATGTDPANLALIWMAGRLQAASRGAVLAGSLPGSGAGSAIDELIHGTTGVHLSSVDDADTPVGQIVVAQALSYLLDGRKPQAYGVGSGVAPSPAPTPAATPTSRG